MTADEGRRLPPGSHGIPADVVARNQRERLVAAIAEECAERGFAETSVAAVAKRAGVSSPRASSPSSASTSSPAKPIASPSSPTQA